MWKCHKCGKPVYFAERKQSLGYDWHPECLRCEECGKRLNPGQHAEHKGVPYCHVPCYGALFGPQLFGHGTRVESHKNFGQKGIQRVNGGGPALPRDHLESKLKLYNEFYDNKSLKVRSREVNNRLILEGALRVYWGVQNVIHLKEDDDQRTVAIRKRNSARYSTSAIEQDNSDKENDVDASDSIEPATTTTTTGPLDDFSTDISLSESMTFDSCSLNDYPLSEDATTPTTPTATSQSTTTTNTGSTSSTLPSKLDNLNSLEWDEIDDLLQVERRYSEKDKIYETMPVKLPSSQSSSDSSPTKSASDKSNSTTTETSSDNFITASASLATTTTTTSTNVATTDDDETLKPMDFEEFKRSIHQEYVNGTNDLPEVDENTLKKNQPIDPSRINDSLKLYGENAMSKSFNCEQALRTIDPAMINDTLCRRAVSGIEHSSARNYALQKSGSANLNHNHHGKSLFEKGINRSKSGPTCFEFTDSDEESSSTLKPGKPTTIKRNEPRYVNIRMNCYASSNDNDTSAGKGGGDTNSSSIAGDLTVTETYVNGQQLHVTEDGVVLRRPPRTGSTAIKRRSGNKRSRTKLKRRCSINGHFYNRETSFFTPPYGSQMSVWVTSLVTTQEVINLVLEKYRVDSPAENFSLFILRDNGEQKRLKELDYPLLVRIMLGPHEDVARLFLMDAQKTQEISNEVAQFINLSIPECRAILDRYNDELEREIAKVREKYAELRRRIVNRMESLKVRL